MECNRDEALRAKELAEKKMQDNDFEGAKKVALKAERLYPQLENISQLLAVCNVHCSALSSTIGTEKDWYGILQMDKKADEVTIKKQYRRLALVLHPDKNKFPGAEAAFKLIGEANMVLCDPSRRSLYDSKRMVAAKQPVRQNYNVRNGFPNQQQTQPTPSALPESFWTGCPFCNVRYQYYKNFINRAVRCQKCAKPFIAYDLGCQGQGPIGHKWSHPNVPPNTNASQSSQQKAVPNQGMAATQMGSKPSVTTQAAKGKGDKEIPKVVNLKNMKKSQKKTVESSESIDTSSSSESEVEEVGNVSYSSADRRKSSRQRQNVSYKEGGASDDENELTSPLKKVRTGGDTSKDKKKEAVSGDDSVCPTSKAEATQNGAAPNKSDKQAVGPSPSKVEEDSDSEHSEESPTQYECPEPEFNDFDKHKEKSCFAVDQVWACYDDADGMPRYYCLIKKVLVSPDSEFELCFTWLEALPEDEGSKEWVAAGLPAGCGRFRRGKSETTKEHLMFSHLMQLEKGKRGKFFAYPRKGETWALFKDWDMGWSSDPEKHSNYKYEIVEVLSDFVEDDGIKVSYLDKVSGFVSLFKASKVGSFFVKPDELYRFSHQIPSFRMSGTEKEGVPVGSFELDPASVPLNPDDLWYPGKETDNSTSAKQESKMSENLTPKKSVAATDGESSKVRRSPRGVNISMTRKL